MYSKTEMQLMHGLSKGVDSVSGLSDHMDKSEVTVYRTIRSLEEKDTVHMQDGHVVMNRKTHLSLLMNVLHDSRSAVTLLSGMGMDIISELIEPLTAEELAGKLDVSHRTISRYLKRMYNVSMISADGYTYHLNERIWPELAQFVQEYNAYRKSIDLRIPAGSRLYDTAHDILLFSNDADLDDFQLTGFSRFEDYGITMHMNTKYYCNRVGLITIQDVMHDCLVTVAADGDWRSKMMALIFYKKYRGELIDVGHPLIAEMECVLAGKRMEGWVPLNEMQERADMYGVDLYDN